MQCGPALGGLLYHIGGYKLPFLAMSVAILILSVVIVVGVPYLLRKSMIEMELEASSSSPRNNVTENLEGTSLQTQSDETDAMVLMVMGTRPRTASMRDTLSFPLILISIIPFIWEFAFGMIVYLLKSHPHPNHL